MNSKRKLLISMLAIVFVLLAVVATVAIAFALTQQTITTTLNIGYAVEDIDGSVSATYTIGGTTNYLEPIADADHVSQDNRSLIFKATDTTNAGNLMFPEGQIPLSAQNDNVVIKYTYANTGDRHYIASMSFDAALSYTNMKVEYSINGQDYSENRYAVVVPANSSNKSYWIRISVADKAKNASFVGDFNWLLNGCDEQSDEYLSLTSLEFQGSEGVYTAAVASTGAYVGELVIPKSVNGDTVTTINQATSLTADQKAQIKSVYIPENVTTIGTKTFDGYSNLETVTFEQNEASSVSVQNTTGLTTIGSYAFRNCTKLREVIIPDTVTLVDQYAFYGCSSMQYLEIGKAVTTIGSRAFQSCTGLRDIYYNAIAVSDFASSNYIFSSIGSKQTSCNFVIGADVTKVPAYLLWPGSTHLTSVTSLTIGENVQTIGDYAFFGLKSLTNLHIPKSVTTIADNTFKYLNSLDTITVEEGSTKFSSNGNCLIDKTNKRLIIGLDNTVIPTDGSVTSIADYAFNSKTELTNINIPNTVISVGKYAFQDCTSLTSIEFPDSVKTLDNRIFQGCSSLESAIIGNGVTTIGEYLFFSCVNLKSVYIGSSVSSIGKQLFYDCETLESITVSSNNTTYHSAGNCLIETASKTLIYGCTTSVIPADGSVTKIDNNAFYYSVGLKEIVIPDSVTTVGEYAFYGTGLTTITIGSGVTSIGQYAFYICSNLQKVIVKDINKWAAISFAATSSNPLLYAKKLYLHTDLNSPVEQVDLTNCTTIGNYAFYSCSTIKSVVISKSINNIGKYAFYNCIDLTNVTAGNGVKTIGDFAFEGCSSLQSVYIADSLTTIGINAFYNCSSLTTITLPSTLTMVGSYAKSYYYSSTASNRDREDYRFSPFDGCPLQFTTYNNCSYLGNETNPYVLLVKCNNTSITSVEIHPNTKVIDNMAFYNCKSLTSVVIPDQVVHIGIYAFASCSALTNVTISASVKTIMTRAFYSCSALTSVTFNDTDTWYVASGTTVSVTDTALNATNLTNYKNYSYYIWTKDTATNAGKVFVDHAFWV